MQVKDTCTECDSRGGDCAEVRHDLKDVRQLQASYYAFAAIKGDGTVA